MKPHTLNGASKEKMKDYDFALFYEKEKLINNAAKLIPSLNLSGRIAHALGREILIEFPMMHQTTQP